MDTKQLRQKILDLAIRGKLVPQDPNDEPASVLLERVKAEKERLIAEGKIKRSRKSAASDKPHYADWNLPSGWVWVKLEDIAIDMADGPFGSNLKSSHYTTDREVRIIQLSNIGEYGWRDDNVRYTTFEHAKDIQRSIVDSGDIVIAKMMPAGRAIICPNKDKAYVLSSDAVKLKPSSLLNISYLLYAINSPLFQNQVNENVQGVTRLRTSIAKLKSYAFPLPPLNEQTRIVNSLVHYLSIIDNIQDSIESINGGIVQVKSKILELAISGKLVAQDPSDEPAADLLQRVNPNAVVSTDKSHYSIPSTWIWVKLSDIFEINPKNHNNDDEDDCGFVPMSYVQDGYSGEHTFEVRKWGKVKQGYSHFQNGDIGVAKISPCFENLKSTIFHSLPNNIGAGTTELVIMRGKEIFAPFFLYLFKSPWYISKGTVYFKGVVGQQRVSRDIFTSLEVPLPPLNEQKRISAKVDELFAVIDQIQQSLE